MILPIRAVIWLWKEPANKTITNIIVFELARYLAGEANSQRENNYMSNVSKKILLRAMPSLRYMLILRPRMQAKYEGKTEMGEYVQFKNGYAEVTEMQFEQIKQLAEFGTEIVVAEKKVELESPMQPKVSSMNSPEDRVAELEKKLDKSVGEINESLETIAKAVASFAENKAKKPGRKKAKITEEETV